MSEQYPKAVVCRVLGMARSNLYRRSSVVPDEKLDAAMKDICAGFPCYGYRRVTAELRRQGWSINRKRVARLMKVKGLQAKKWFGSDGQRTVSIRFPVIPIWWSAWW